jgi:STE24 endopeptidase
MMAAGPAAAAEAYLQRLPADLLAAAPAATAWAEIQFVASLAMLVLGGVAAVLMFSAIWLPFATASGPTNLPTAPPGPARDGLMQLIAAVHLPAHEIYVSANSAIDADVTGWGQARVVISHGLWISAPPAELRASIGHLMGHYAHHDQLSIALLLAVLTFGLFIIVRRLAMPAARLMGLKDVEGPANPVAAPALIAVAVVYLWLAVTCDHAFIRWINVRADQYSLDHAKEPDGLALALLDEWRGEAVDPSPVQEALFYDHPSLKSRLEHAMRWKAAHPALAPAASGSGA